MLLAAAWLPFAAGAGCIENPDPELHRLQELVSEVGTKALRQARSQLDVLQHGPLRDLPGNASRRAALFAIQAQAYGILELDGKAREAAAKGLALATGKHDPVHLELLSAYAENVYDKAGIASAIEAVEAARMLQPRGSTADTCLLMTRGLLEHRQDRADLAIVTLTQAYRASIAPAVTEQHIRSADYLSLVMRSMGDYSEALSLFSAGDARDISGSRRGEPGAAANAGVRNPAARDRQRAACDLKRRSVEQRREYAVAR